MATLIRAIDGHAGIPANFPILVTERMEIVEPAFTFLIELATIPGRSHSADTVRTYAEHLHDWFDSLEQSSIEWRDVREETIAAYRNRMLEQPSAHTGRPYARSTINDRIRTVCRFYDWAHRRGWVDETPFHSIDVGLFSAKRQSFFAHLNHHKATVAANVLTVPEREALPRPLRLDELKRMFARLSPTYCLIAQWALATGMRRKELCALALSQIPDVADVDMDNQPLVGVALTITKGDRPRTVYPPIRLIDRTHWYIGEDRAALIRRVRRQFPSYRSSQLVFLNSKGVVSRSRLTAALAAAFDACGLDGTLHWLRHTFAMTMLVRLQAQAALKPDINPLKVLQILLGHSSIQTTAIYLRCVELHAQEISESLEYLYGGAIGDAL